MKYLLTLVLFFTVAQAQVLDHGITQRPGVCYQHVIHSAEDKTGLRPIVESRVNSRSPLTTTGRVQSRATPLARRLFMKCRVTASMCSLATTPSSPTHNPRSSTLTGATTKLLIWHLTGPEHPLWQALMSTSDPIFVRFSGSEGPRDFAIQPEIIQRLQTFVEACL